MASTDVKDAQVCSLTARKEASAYTFVQTLTVFHVAWDLHHQFLWLFV